MNLFNNVFDGVTVTLDPTWHPNTGLVNCDMTLESYNNLFRGGSAFMLIPIPASGGNLQFYDNLFDQINFQQCIVDAAYGPLIPFDFDNNAYWPLPTNDLSSPAAFNPWNQLLPTSTGEGAYEVVRTRPIGLEKENDGES